MNSTQRIKDLVASETRPFRHELVKLITPNLYRTKRNFPRPTISFIKNLKLKKQLVGAEIGVAWAFNAESILRSLRMKRLFLIDPYIPYVQKFGHGRSSCRCDYSRALERAKWRLSKFSHKITWIRKTSEDAIYDVPGNMDFVYIDGNHSFKFVKKDIELYYPKIVHGGVLGGHDFYSNCMGVCRAVFQFADSKGLQVNGALTDWWLIKK